jgi:hypothetical protein
VIDKAVDNLFVHSNPVSHASCVQVKKKRRLILLSG